MNDISSDNMTRCAIREALAGPVVSAAPGHFLLYECNPGGDPEPILAWRIGNEMVLPVTAVGCVGSQHWVLYPDGSVRPHFKGYNHDQKSYKSFAAWHISVTGRDP
jgi:hypothetical protein